MQTMIEVICAYCNKPFQKRLGAYNETNKKGSSHCCSKSCQSQIANRKHSNRKTFHLKPDNRLDELSPFKYFLFNMRLSSKQSKRKIVEVDSKDLKNIWENQKGICPITGWSLLLPKSSRGWNKSHDTKIKASVDRIDNSKGYILGNIRFVSLMVNLAKNKFSEEDLFLMCKAVVDRKSSVD